jgi:hypothetical protein
MTRDYLPKGCAPQLNKKHKELILDLLFFLVQAIYIIGLYDKGNNDYVRMALDNVIFWIAYIILERRKRWQIPIYIRFITLIAITFNNVLGEYYDLYLSSSVYDRLQHIFGTYALTL